MLLDILQKQINSPWLQGYETKEFYRLLTQYFQQLQQYSPPQKICLVESEPLHFLAKFVACVSLNCPVFLCDPHWQQQEWQKVLNIAKPNYIWRDFLQFSQSSPVQDHEKNWIMIPTGGTSGNICFAIHTWETLSASVAGFSQYFATQNVNSCCLLPLYHVSGLMQFMRVILIGGTLSIFSYPSLKKGLFPDIDPLNYFISLVPPQLQFLLDHFPQWLAQFKTVLVGGAPTDKRLLEKAREYHIKIALTYGMTETASQVVTLNPANFLQGNDSSGQVLPHAKITICDDSGKMLLPEKTGTIVIKSQSLFKGYYGDIVKNNSCFVTDDLGYFDKKGYLVIMGRKSRKIITGGENVFPDEIEGILLESELVTDVCIVGIPDVNWGEVIVAMYVPQSKDITPRLLEQYLMTQVSRFKHPKYWFAVSELPRNDQGKVQYNQVRDWVMATLMSYP